MHPYQIGLIYPDDEAFAEDVLFDSLEDAAHQVREWLPNAPRFLGRRELERAKDATKVFFDDRAGAIAWLLETTTS